MNLIGSGILIVGNILGYTMASWLLIHVIALFGIFLGLSYPLWWFFFPKQTVCFICRSTKDKNWCYLCHRYVNKGKSIAPKTLLSSLCNGFIILLLSFLSIAVVFGESQLLKKMGFPPTQKTVLFSIPAKGQHRLGEIFPLEMNISGIKTPINVVQTDLHFDPTILEVVDISTVNSFATIFIQKEIDNTKGFVRLVGGLPNPGYTGEQGLFGEVLLKGKKSGIANIEFLPTSKVLANDGKGTNVLKDLSAFSYVILPEKITHEEEKLQEQFKQAVLGQSIGDTQMVFYEKDKPVISGQLDEVKTQDKSLVDTTLQRITAFDLFVISLWQKVTPF